ncbi:MAG TPA: hypothetical protein VLT87_11250 [Thermoanaerobaculia bacterium]|nr:hypothetical protein [Thermoanaerobaculia bacterium]
MDRPVHPVSATAHAGHVRHLYFLDAEAPVRELADMTIEFASSSQRVARKEHDCPVCRRPILAGTLYEEITGKSDGAMYRDRLHVECLAIFEMAYAICPTQDPISFGDTGEIVRDYGDSDLIRRWAEASGADPAPLLREWAGEGEA